MGACRQGYYSIPSLAIPASMARWPKQMTFETKDLMCSPGLRSWTVAGHGAEDGAAKSCTTATQEVEDPVLRNCHAVGGFLILEHL